MCKTLSREMTHRSGFNIKVSGARGMCIFEVHGIWHGSAPPPSIPLDSPLCCNDFVVRMFGRRFAQPLCDLLPRPPYSFCSLKGSEEQLS